MKHPWPKSLLTLILIGTASQTALAFGPEKNLKVGERYELPAATLVHAQSPAKTFNLPPGSEFEVLGWAKDVRGTEIARLGLDVDAESGVPSELWVPKSDLKWAFKAAPASDSLERNDDFLEYNDSFLDALDGNTLQAMRRKKRGGGGMTYCYRDVKKTLLRMGICRRYASGSMAWQGYSILQRECGMRPVAFSKNLPAGAVCVSSGGRSCGSSKCGHIAVKTGAGSWFGAGTRGSPWIGGRSPMGCLVRR